MVFQSEHHLFKGKGEEVGDVEIPMRGLNSTDISLLMT